MDVTPTSWEEAMSLNRGDRDYEWFRLIFRPISLLYFMVIVFWTLMLFPLYLFTGAIFSRALGLSPLFTILVFLFSLLGSHVNIPIKEVASIEPLVTFRRISFFGVSWIIPELSRRKRRTIIAVNVGGALVPIALSLYLLLLVVPFQEPNPFVTYIKILAALIVVTLSTNLIARPIRGVGIATPTFLPPLITALASLMVFQLHTPSNPSIIAYVSGTLGTLIGADLLNLEKISRMGAPIVSIGGAGTFDGIYVTGLMAVFLVLILL